MRCMFFFTVRLCVLFQKELSLLLPICGQSYLVEALYILHVCMSCLAVLDFLDFDGTANFAISSQGFFLAGEDWQQTDQPNDQAGG